MWRESTHISYDFKKKAYEFNQKAYRHPKSLHDYLDDLFVKRGSTRELALSFIVEGLKVNYQRQFAENNFATILYRCLNSFKKGSIKERRLACDVLGMLAITIGCGDKAHELYVESFPILADALKSEIEVLNLVSILNCMAIVTFVGRNHSEETQSSMLNIWEYLNTELDYIHVGRENHFVAAQNAAISAWSLLLSSMDGWKLNHKYWQGAIPFFEDLLEAEEESVHVAASETLALIFEVGCLEKFAGNTTISGDSSSYDFPETSIKIGNQTLKPQKWCQLIQLNFIKGLLGGGFVTHMMENENLQDIFDFTPKKTKGKAPYVSEREEVKIRLFVPVIKEKHTDDFDQKQRAPKGPSRALCKARTQVLNKNRDIRGEEVWSSYGD